MQTVFHKTPQEKSHGVIVEKSLRLMIRLMISFTKAFIGRAIDSINSTERYWTKYTYSVSAYCRMQIVLPN